jgi:hypothetical protein
VDPAHLRLVHGGSGVDNVVAGKAERLRQL